MSELPRIDSEESLEAWLKTRNRKDVVIAANRIAMRVIPIWISGLAESWAQQDGLTAIPVLRANLLPGVVCRYPVRALVRSAIDAAGLADNASCVGDAFLAALNTKQASSGMPAIAEVAACAAYAVVGREFNPTMSFFPFFNSKYHPEIWQAIETDARLMIGGSDLSEFRLWTGENPLVSGWQQALPILYHVPGGEFWIDWYQRALDGRPQNWPLLHDVALIDNALWVQGGEALDRAISFTVERHRLLDGVRRLRDSLRAAEQSSETIIGPGHNHPPGPLDPEPDLIAACDNIQQGLEAAEQALMEPTPSFAVLRRIGRMLGDAALAVMGYCGRLADAAAMEAAKSIGKWGGAAGIAWCAANAESIQKLAKELLQWVAGAS